MLPVRSVCIFAGSICTGSQNKEIAASHLPSAEKKKKQSIFAPGDLGDDAGINHPACTCPKRQAQSHVSLLLGSCCGSSAVVNQSTLRCPENLPHTTATRIVFTHSFCTPKRGRCPNFETSFNLVINRMLFTY